MAEIKPPTDQDLVSSALRDSQAYALIVRRYEPPLRRYVGRLIGSRRDIADDILQETFLKAYVNLNDYDPTRPFSPWMYRIAHNQAVSQLRKHGVAALTINGEEGERILLGITGGVDMQEMLDTVRNEKRLTAAVAALEPRYRDVMVLRFLEERSYEDIADILRLPMGTVATLVSRGKDRLRKALAATGFDR